MQKLCTLVLGVLGLAGCAHDFIGTYQPMVDLTGADPGRFESDLSECREFAITQEHAARLTLTQIITGGAQGAEAERQLTDYCMARRNYRPLARDGAGL